jgi:hypothetical protein
MSCGRSHVWPLVVNTVDVVQLAEGTEVGQVDVVVAEDAAVRCPEQQVGGAGGGGAARTGRQQSQRLLVAPRHVCKFPLSVHQLLQPVHDVVVGHRTASRVHTQKPSHCCTQ